MRFRILFLVLVIVFGLAACSLGSDEATFTPEPPPGPTMTFTPSGRPTVTIISPQNGAEVVVNEPILMSINAMDNVGVTRVQLVANNQNVGSFPSQSPAGDTNWNRLIDYTPTTQGSLTLQVIAFRGTVTSDPASITVTVRAAP